MKKKLSIILIFVLISALSLALVACGDPADTPDNSYPPQYYDKTLATAFVSIDVNPSIELTLNYDNKVLSAYGANDDGKVLLYGEDGIVGEDVETAIQKITELAVELGYLSEDNSCVQTSVLAICDTIDKEVVDSLIEQAAEDLNITVRVENLNTYSLTLALDEFKAANENIAAAQQLSLDNFKILSSAAEAKNAPVETLLTLDDNALLQTISKAHAQSEGYETEEYVKEYNLANDVYQKALGAVTDSIYTGYYMLHHPFKAYYGLAYEGYKLTARGLNAIANAIDYIGEVREYPLAQTHIDDVVKILNLENSDPLKNANGDVTIKSIEAYADKKFKETEFSQALETMKAELTAALKTTKEAIQTVIDELSAQYADEIEVISDSLSSILDGIKGIESILPAPIQAAIDDFTGVVSDLVHMVSDLRISVSEIRGLADSMQKKSDASLNRIKNDLSESELERIAQLQQSAIDEIEDAKARFEQAIQDAKNSAKQYLENIKNERKAA
ncbi:MAG: apolipoprotein A1/A4/E family protein [Bacteroides sp.]|nr:apolipoprotein A1/A4/E family protein [Bacillota bacterium]MCM1394326.1 apolipoprotein A1/A4/E family protein [[Eubacterium] siraeum]MCM1455155.1 apolipoprotein A1/A4/E family protein [Bacteroides sp.]